MNPDTSFLSAEERQVVNLLIQAADLMNPIYLRQRYVENPQIRTAIERTRRADQALLLDMYDLHFGPWDTLAENHPFWGTTEWPEGAGFYQTDLTKAEFEAYPAEHQDQKEREDRGHRKRVEQGKRGEE